ncbi:Calcium-transporting ATPase [Tepidanaerobacter acetatoxydans Re1]|uniref:P-type Ca(2+) transporter n=1 Tax=Tepidanaerobacter acetatoxydans (strain DSM 21804 / JCM 16047 / Re1) TaxID=1209989 RepID=F4LVI5_TEPAE|nr:calcium-transporting P-type ATPase, PMR1-type [Tepidanaerobacter acetatoxydans]AEE91571.1 calcium-translocating P-type ATPase, PMCA-type [Tepidanaerobacter acetatoxydans Re1]CCP26293.1 Calcium-transporting ATPase [Tepidanaerobacter acetatoxydans Re1]
MEKINWYSLEKEDISGKLNTDLKNGLPSDLVEKRLESIGYNELVGKKGVTIWQMLLEQFKDFLVLILIGASFVSAIIGEVTDAVVIILIVILNAVLGVMQEFRANKALEALKEMAAPEAKVIRDGKIIEIPSRELVPGDLVLLEAGNYVPADIRLVESVNLKIEEASLTGESVPAEKNAEVVLGGEVPLGDRSNSAFMGTVVTYGRGKGIVVATGMNTEIGLIAEMLESYEEGETPLQKKLDELGKILGIASLAICGIVFLLGIFRGIPILEMFMTSVSLAVAAIPEGLPAIVTIVLALGMQRMVQKHAIIKKLHAVETLGSTTVICSDKTGTLTQNEMTARKVFVSNKVYSISGEGYKPHGDFSIGDSKCEPLADTDLKMLLTIGLLCNDAKLEESSYGDEKTWRIIGDPTEGCLVVAATKAGLDTDELCNRMPRLQEIPFDSERKRMTTFHSYEQKYVAFTKGAPDIMLNLSSKILKNGKIFDINDEDRKQILEVNHNMASQALRVLAFAFKPINDIPKKPDPVEIEKDMVFVGLIGMIDPARPEAKDAIRICKEAGIRPVMITGDYKDTAEAIARELGMIDENSKALTGTELDMMDEQQLAAAAKEVSVYARVSPIHKLRIVDAIKQNGHIVAMTGDGVNDAPALKKADIGIAMGITGTDVAKEAADMILTDDNFASIVSAVEEGRVIYSNIRKFIFFLLSCNIAEILIIFVAMLFGLPVPLKPIQLLWLNLLTDAFPALALGMEAKEPNIMKRPPRNPDEPILDRQMNWQIAIQSTFMTIAVLGVFVFSLNNTSNLEIARTYAFATLIFSELLRAYTSRSETLSVFKIGFFSNKFMVGGTLVSFLLLLVVLYVPALRYIFDTVKLSIYDWDIIVLFGIMPFLAAEIGKMFLKSK